MKSDYVKKKALPNKKCLLSKICFNLYGYYVKIYQRYEVQDIYRFIVWSHSAATHTENASTVKEGSRHVYHLRRICALCFKSFEEPYKSQTDPRVFDRNPKEIIYSSGPHAASHLCNPVPFVE